jgi:polysaccharide biosynthesis transport protein
MSIIRYAPVPAATTSYGSARLAPDPARSTDLQLSDLRRVLRKRRTVILITVATMLVSAIAYSVLKTPLYEATARLTLNFDNQDFSLSDAAASKLTGMDAETNAQTQVRVLESETLALEVIRRLHLDQNRDFLGKQVAELPKLDLPARTSVMLKTFQDHLRVAAIPRTNIIEVRFRTRSPLLAADVANTLVNAYMERNFQVKYEATAHASDWLSKQLGDLKESATASQEKLAAYQKSHNLLFLGTSETDNTATAKLEKLEAQLAAVHADRIMKEAVHRLAQSGNPELVSAVAPNSTMAVLRAQEAELKNQYAQATAKYGGAYPRVAQLNNQLAQVEEALKLEVVNTAERLKGQYEAAFKTERALSGSVEKEKGEAYKVNANAVEYMILRREAESSRDLYQGLLKKLKEAGIMAGLRSTNVTILDQAQVPSLPVEPRPLLNISLGLLVGLLLAAGLAYVMESLDQSIESVFEAEFCSGLPSLGLIPKFRLRRRQARGLVVKRQETLELITACQPKSHIAEAFRGVRSSILLSTAENPPKALVITSAFPREGKSAVSINTGIVLSQQGARVLLVDADLRRSQLHISFGVKQNPGLSQVLAGVNLPEEAMVAAPGLPNLMLMPAGSPAPNPAELLGSKKMRTLLDTWAKEFDHVVIDTPPVLSVTDAVVLAAQADAVLLVLRSGTTGKHALVRSRDLLLRANAKIAGVVVNAVDLKSTNAYYY